MARKIVIGLGKTGWSVVRFLVQRGEECLVLDQQLNPPFLKLLQQYHPDVPYVLGSIDFSLIKDAEEIIVSPGVPLDQPFLQQAKASGISIIGDIELFVRYAQAPIIAITGSNGKSTVTSLVGDMAAQAPFKVGVGGNIGVPALDLLSDNKDLYVLEISSFQLDSTTSLRAKASVILNVSPDHLDRYPSLAAYRQSKLRIHENSHFVLCNRDDVSLRNHCPPADASFGLDCPAQESDYGLLFLQESLCLAQGQEPIFPVEQLKIHGMHNVANALAAVALADVAGVPRLAISNVLSNFTGLAHRTQWVDTLRDVHYYNDSKGTNVGATQAALEGLPGKVVLIAGGVGKDQNFGYLRAVVERKCRAVVLLGRDAALIAKALDNAAPLCFAKDMFEAVHIASSLAAPQDSVLLSPACASFDMFESYVQRGEVFVEAVRGLRYEYQSHALA
jgi:UDP-N-acetylmuramoylalanine--D-glutamate ligase